MAENSTFRVLGIDPGLNITGYGLVDIQGHDHSIVEAGTIRTDAKAEMPVRLSQIYADLTEILAEFKPDLIGVEQLYAHYNHPRTSILMGHARGVILLAGQQAGVKVCNLAATQVKKSLTGNGHATKQQMQLAIQSMFRLDEPPSPPDVADALAIALCASKHALSTI